MSRPRQSAVLRLRVSLELERRIERAARRRHRTKSAVLREGLQRAFGAGMPSVEAAREARRQSLLVSRRASEQDALEFIQHTAADANWR